MERQEILDMMGQLKLVGMRSAYDEVIEDGIRRQQPMPYVVGALLQAQIAAAHARSIAYQMGMARFPWPRRSRSSTSARRRSTRPSSASGMMAGSSTSSAT